MIQYIRCFKNFAALQPFFYIFLLKWRRKWRRFWVQRILWSFKNIILFLTQGLIFISFLNDHIQNIVSTLPNAVQTYVENDNVLLKLSTLLNVVNFNIHIHNVISTLIWRCVTSQLHINLNVCWFILFYLFYCFIICKISNNMLVYGKFFWYTGKWANFTKINDEPTKYIDSKNQKCIHIKLSI